MSKSKLKKSSNAGRVKSVESREEQKSAFINSFNFDMLVKKLHRLVQTLPDKRTGNNISKSLTDAFLCAFSVFFTQSPSFLAHQKSMQEDQGENNARSLFGIEEILSISHICRLLDAVSPSYVFPMFETILDGLSSHGYLTDFRSYLDNLVVALDGTEYFSSNTIHCDDCSQTHSNNGSVRYSHTVITPVLIKPGNDKVISLQPEFVIPQDGHEKQDSETAAAKRWIKANGARLKQLRVTIVGDDLYCRQPMCQLIQDQGLNFILTCKEESHSTLYEYVDFLKEDIRTVQVLRWKGKKQFKDTYRFVNTVPLRNEEPMEVNWCELKTTRVGDDSGKAIYMNTFATNFEITKENVIQIVADGRARWKIENENNNVLKTKGYHLEHNFGHGKQHLSSLLLTLNLLAFLFHTLLELSDETYCLIRKKLPTRKTFFQDIRALTRYTYYEGWNELTIFMLRGLIRKHKIP